MTLSYRWCEVQLFDGSASVPNDLLNRAVEDICFAVKKELGNALDAIYIASSV